MATYKSIVSDKVRPSSEIPPFVALSFFSGALGLDIGLEMAGIPSILTCEVDSSCRHTITLNRPEKALIGDITAYRAKDIYTYANLPENHPIDLIFGGSPCQSFSTIGQQGGFNDPRGNLALKYLELIGELRPRYVVLENVRGLLSAEGPVNSKMQKGGALRTIVSKLESFGYTVSFNLYNSAYYGAPQIRERMILMAHLGEAKLPYLTPTHSDDAKYKLPKPMTLKDALSQLPPDTVHTHTNFTPKRLAFYKLLSAGQNWRDLPEHLQEEAIGNAFHSKGGGRTGYYRRLSFDKPSPTLLTTPTMFATSLAHPVEDRPLSVEEYAVIQGFPLDYKFCGTISDKYKQIGNAVPIALAEAIGKTILAHNSGKVLSAYPDFPYSRYKNTDDESWRKQYNP